MQHSTLTLVIILTESVTEEIQVIFTGNSFNAIVEDIGEEKVECVPTIYRKESNIGLRIDVKNFKKFFFIEESNNDPFKAYRTMMILSRLSIINVNLMSSAFLASDRTKEVSMLGFSPPLSDIIKMGELRKIMMELVPEKIIQAIIKDGKELSDKERFILEQEILAETIPYDDRIAKLEIKEPREIAKEIEDIKTRGMEIYGRIFPILESYFIWFEDLNDAIVQETLYIILLDKYDFSDEVAVAVGGFLAQVNYCSLLNGDAEEESFVGNLFQERINEITIDSIYWLSDEEGCTPDEAANKLDNALHVIFESE